MAFEGIEIHTYTISCIYSGTLIIYAIGQQHLDSLEVMPRLCRNILHVLLDAPRS